MWTDGGLGSGALAIIYVVTAFVAICAVGALVWLAMKRADDANLRRFPPRTTARLADRRARALRGTPTSDDSAGARPAPGAGDVEPGRLPGDL